MTTKKSEDRRIYVLSARQHSDVRRLTINRLIAEGARVYGSTFERVKSSSSVREELKDKRRAINEVVIVNPFFGVFDRLLADEDGSQEIALQAVSFALKHQLKLGFIDPENGRIWMEENKAAIGHSLPADYPLHTFLKPHRPLPESRVVSTPAKLAPALVNVTERASLVDFATNLLELAESGWGVIANVNGGDWKGASDDWRGAAERWRDEYHTMLRNYDANLALRPIRREAARRVVQERVDRLTRGLTQALETGLSTMAHIGALRAAMQVAESELRAIGKVLERANVTPLVQVDDDDEDESER